MTPTEDATLGLNIIDAYPWEKWGFIAQQTMEPLLNAMIVLGDERSLFSHKLRVLADCAGVALSPDLLACRSCQQVSY